MEFEPCPQCGMMHPGLVHPDAAAELPVEAAVELAEAAVEVAEIEAEAGVETAEIFAAVDEARIESNTEVELARIEADEHIEIAAIEADAAVAIAEEISEVAIAEVVADAVDSDGDETGVADGDEVDEAGDEGDAVGDDEEAIAVAPPPRIEPNRKGSSDKPRHQSAFARRHQRTRSSN